MVLWRDGVLGEGAVGPAEYLVTGLEPGHVLADRLDASGDIHAQHGNLGFARPEGWDHETDHVGQAGHDVPVAAMDAGRLDLDQDLVVGGHRLIDVPERQHPGPAIAVLDNCLHGVLPRRREFG